MPVTTFTWASAQSGAWNTPGNWTANSGFPDSDNSSSDSVVIAVTGAAYTITYAQTTTNNTIGTLSISSANANLSLSSGSSLTDEGALDLTAGTITVNSSALLTDNSNTTAPVVGGLLDVNGGTVVWDGATGAAESTGGTISVSNGGNVQISQTLDQGAGTIIVNGGTLAAHTDFLTAGGSIDVTNSGSLIIANAFSIAGGDLLELDSGGTATSGGTLTVSGLVETQSGTGTIGWSNLAGTGTIEANGGTLIVKGGIFGTNPMNFVVGNSAASNLSFSTTQDGITVTFAGSAGQVSMASVQTFTPDTIVGLNAGSSKTNFIDLLGQNVTATGSGASSSGTITLSTGATFNLSGITNFGGGWTVNTTTDGNGGTDVFLSGVCYAAGTHILTDNEERLVDSLRRGDTVLTVVGDALVPRRVRWVGRRHIDIRAHPRPSTVAPIRIQRHAFGDAMPHRDLVVSPDHAILVDGKLICARLLVNGATIRQEKDRASIEYFHVELDAHAILLADGLPAESYLDTGNRGFFANGGQPLVLHPDLNDGTNHPTRETASCHPFVWDAATVRPIWQRLADRAASLGQAAVLPETSTDPELCIVAKGRTVRPLHVADGRYSFVVPNGASDVRIVSRANAPCDVQPWIEDRRTLGVYVARIVVRAHHDVRDIPLDHPGLVQGWWALEQDDGSLRRWTVGDAVVPIPDVNGPAILEVHTASNAMAYVQKDARHQAA